MRKALVPMFACLALCGAATTAIVISSASAQPGPRKPVMMAATDTSEPQLAANDAPPGYGPERQRGMRRPEPGDIAARLKQMCQDRYAGANGRLAYLETSLNLTTAEKPLFDRWKNASLGVAHHHADQCAQDISRRLAERQANTGANTQKQPEGQQRAMNRPGPAERMAREEDRLKERLADIQAERPALEALTNALSPEQKTQLARGDGREGGRRGMMGHSRFAQAMGPQGMGPRGPMGMDRGRMDGPMGPPGPPDGAPPLER